MSLTLIIGWDGAPYDRIQKWVEEGDLPVLSKLVKNGCLGPLETTPLTISSCAWTTMATGKNAGKHGVYDFFGSEFAEESYFRNPVNSLSRKGKTLWSLLSENGKRVGTANVPFTYPVEKVDGFMIGGMLSPSKKTSRSVSYTHLRAHET